MILDPIKEKVYSIYYNTRSQVGDSIELFFKPHLLPDLPLEGGRRHRPDKNLPSFEYPNYSYISYSARNNPNLLYNAEAFYMGSVENIQEEIRSRLKTNLTELPHRIYLDKNSKYPTTKIDMISSITRSRKPENADLVIIDSKNNVKLSNYQGWLLPYFVNLEDVEIYYSQVTNSYYIIDYYISDTKYYSSDILKYLNSLVTHTIKGLEVSLTSFARFLIKTNIIPSDCELYYSGPIVTLTSIQKEYINNIYNRYSNIIYDYMADQILQKYSINLTYEDVCTIDTMLSSNDKAVRELGLKMLCSYNFVDYISTVYAIISTRRLEIKETSFSKSTLYKNLVNYIETVSKRDFNWFLTEILYNKTVNPIDKEFTKRYIIEQISKNLKEHYNRFYKEKYKFLNLNLKEIIIENNE